MFSEATCKCPCSGCEGILRLDLVEGWLECPDCEEHFTPVELREAAHRLIVLADWLEGTEKLAAELEAVVSK